jgi:hypothetical protein
MYVTAGGPGDPARGPMQLWIADTATGKARPLLGSRRLNTVFDSYTWCAWLVLLVLRPVQSLHFLHCLLWLA